jgi:hypothetical protein
MAAFKEEEESLHSITHSGIQKSMYNLAMRSKLNISPSITKAIDETIYKTELVIPPYSNESILIVDQNMNILIRSKSSGFDTCRKMNIENMKRMETACRLRDLGDKEVKPNLLKIKYKYMYITKNSGKSIEPETSYCISSKISVKNILLKKLNLIKSAFNDRYEIEF